jgi:methylated-DNA-[protein]-cysteine S-methyltransferase
MTTMTKTTRHDIRVGTVGSPIGAITLAFEGDALVTLRFAERDDSVWAMLARRYGADAEIGESDGRHPAATALQAYFAGDLHALDAVVVDPHGTPFQQRVWRELRAIPVGQTASYAQIAQRVGAPQSFRAVARANATNPIGIVIPCHRVIGADGALRGYGGGVDRKRWLLEHERAVQPALAAVTP